MASHRPNPDQPGSWNLFWSKSQSKAWLAAMVICVAALLLGGVVGIVAHRASRNAVIETIAQDCLGLSRSIATHVQRLSPYLGPYLGPHLDDRRRSAQYEEFVTFWNSCQPTYPGSFLCVIEAPGRLAVHTKRPQHIGKDVSQVQLPGRRGALPQTVAGLLAAKQDWAGENINRRGVRQIAGYAYQAELDALVVVHVPTDLVESQIASSSQPWALGLTAVLAILMPIALGLLAYSHKQSQHRQRETAAKLQQAQDNLAHAVRISMLGEMAASIAHEISQPLHAVATFSRACRKTLDASDAIERDQLDEWLGDISQAAKQAREITSRLKDFARRNDPCLTEVPLNDIINDSLKLTSATCRSSGVIVALDLVEPSPQVYADPVQIQQVLVNLIQNAVDAMRDNPADTRKIELRCLVDHPRVTLSVIDAGIGPPKDFASLFEPFYSTKQEGLGMGLSISRSIAEAHAGSLSVTNNPNGGAAFELKLPVASAARQMNPRDCRSSLPPPSISGGISSNGGTAAAQRFVGRGEENS